MQSRALEEDDHGSQPLSHHDDSSLGSSVPPHPLGIKPLGNKYFSSGADARRLIGVLQALPDEMLMQLLEYVDERSLRLLGYTCKFLFACCTADDVWKTIFLQ
jgi:hypothetical protein